MHFALIEYYSYWPFLSFNRSNLINQETPTVITIPKKNQSSESKDYDAPYLICRSPFMKYPY